LHIAEMPMDELRQIDKLAKPDDVFLVCDAMTGQDAVNSAKAFNDALDLNGVILTKMDGDARGGAALSIKEVTQVPIKFVGIGEKLEALQEFVPERMAQRIIGQGDLMGIIEKVQQVQQELGEEEIKKQQEKLSKGDFTLDDFRKQMSQITKLGPLQKVMGMIPGMSSLTKHLDDVDHEGDMKRLLGVIDSMTADEKRNPTKVIDQSRRRRIAAGAGVEPHEVNELVKQFDAMAQVMTSMAGKGMRERMRMVRDLQNGAMADPSGQLSRKKVGTGKRLTPQERAKLKKDRDREIRKRRREGKGGDRSNPRG
jgi:signal recognition particle subunit SRP54